MGINGNDLAGQGARQRQRPEARKQGRGRAGSRRPAAETAPAPVSDRTRPPPAQRQHRPSRKANGAGNGGLQQWLGGSAATAATSGGGSGSGQAAEWRRSQRRQRLLRLRRGARAGDRLQLRPARAVPAADHHRHGRSGRSTTSGASAGRPPRPSGPAAVSSTFASGARAPRRPSRACSRSAGAGPWAPRPRPPPAARALDTGVSNVYSNETAGLRTTSARTGSTMALSPLRWDGSRRPKQPAIWNPEDPADPHYDWSFFDNWVGNAVAAGPDAGPPDPRRAAAGRSAARPSGEAICDPDPAALAAFTRAAVRRYSGSFGNLPRVRYWQALNEPNLSLFFEPQYEGDKLVSPDLYRTLLNTFTARSSRWTPSEHRDPGGLGPIAVKGYTIGPITFLKKLLCMARHQPRSRAPSRATAKAAPTSTSSTSIPTPPAGRLTKAAPTTSRSATSASCRTCCARPTAPAGSTAATKV